MDEKQQHEQFNYWLPFYLSGRLGESEQTWMEHYMADHPSASAELHFERALKSSLMQRMPEYAQDAGLNDFMARVRSETDSRKLGSFFASFRQLQQHCKSLLAAMIPDPKLAMASVLLIAQAGYIVVLLSNKTQSTVTEQAQWRSPTNVVEFKGPVLQITFKPTATEEGMRLLLVKIGGSLAGGPGQLGNYWVKVPKDNMAAAEQQVKASPIVESAQILEEMPLDR